MSGKTHLIYVLTATTEEGASRRSAFLSPEKAKAKRSIWAARGWSVELHRVHGTCIDCEEIL